MIKKDQIKKQFMKILCIIRIRILLSEAANSHILEGWLND